MSEKPNQKQIPLDSTNLGRQLTTTWVEEPNAVDEATVRQLEAAAECREALGELYEAMLAWSIYLSCWIGFGDKTYPMISNRCNSLVEKLGTQTFRALTSLEALEQANQELEQAIAEIKCDSLEHLKHYWADEESEPSAEPPKGASLEKNPLLIPPELSEAIGLHEAIVLQQIHYWLDKGSGRIIDGIRWMWNTLDSWHNQFKFLSKWQLRKALRRLRDDLGLVEFSQQQKHEWNRTGWYTINYQRLKALQLSMCEGSHIDVCSPTDRCVTVHTSRRTETTPEISPKTTTPAAAILNFGEEALEVAQVTSLVDQEERELTEEPKTLNRDQFSAAASASVEKLDLVENAEIPLNPQLERTLVNYTLEQIAAALEHYRSITRKKGRRNNPAGWLTDCLKGQWWVGTDTATPEAAHPASRVYTAADFEVVEKSPVSQSFKDVIAGLARKHNFAT